MSAKKVVLKYDIPLQSALFRTRLPVGSQFLTFQEQHRNLRIWVLTDDPPVDLIDHTMVILATGEPFDFSQYRKYDYLGTVQQFEGLRVWHLFRVFLKGDS